MQTKQLLLQPGFRSEVDFKTVQAKVCFTAKGSRAAVISVLVSRRVNETNFDNKSLKSSPLGEAQEFC